MTDISVIILVGKEKLHIRRCLERLASLEPRDVFVITSQPDDGTEAIAREMGAKVVFHAWPGLYAKQFNWALDYVEGRRKSGEGRSKSEEGRSEGEGRSEEEGRRKSEEGGSKSEEGRSKGEGRSESEEGGSEDGWILRLDADEYLTEETIEELRNWLTIEDDHAGRSPRIRTGEPGMKVAGLTLELKRRFCGGEIRHGTNGIRLLRLWRRGRGKSEERAMDEHIAIDGISDLDELRRMGKVIDFDGAFYDDNLNNMDWWREKHRGYAKREAADALAFARGELRFKPIKEKYYRLPRYWRAVAYFAIRYFLKGGFLDGYAGWMWNFWQGLWYRWIVDREIGKMVVGC